MILLSAIPDEWDHLAAYYVQTCTSVANILFDAIQKAILAKFNHSGGSCPDQSHVADEISAIKWKGKPPHFSNQKGADSFSANNNAGPSSSKKRCERKKGKNAQGYSHHQSHIASMAMMVDQSANMQQQATVSLLRGTCERRWETLLRDCQRIEQGIRQLESEVSNYVIEA